MPWSLQVFDVTHVCVHTFLGSVAFMKGVHIIGCRILWTIPDRLRCLLDPSPQLLNGSVVVACQQYKSCNLRPGFA